MEKHIREAMNDHVINEAIVKYDVEFKSVTRLGGFENFIYEFEKNKEQFVLRFVHSSHRSFDYVCAELEFINYLSKSGANVSVVVKTIDDTMLFQVMTLNGEYFTVCVFTKAPGTYVAREAVTTEFITQFGKAVGKLHFLTKSYEPIHKRYHWYEDDFLDIGRRNLPPELQFIVDKGRKHIDKLKEYSMDIDSYGLIHTDLHFGNMYYDGKVLTFFDWDDSSYKHFISDIAIIIFYNFGISEEPDEVIENKVIEFLIPFLKGYHEENILDKYWYTQLNEFIKLRTLILIMVIYAAGEDVLNSRFGTIITNKYINRIRTDKPFIDVNRVMDAIWSS